MRRIFGGGFGLPGPPRPCAHPWAWPLGLPVRGNVPGQAGDIPGPPGIFPPAGDIPNGGRGYSPPARDMTDRAGDIPAGRGYSLLIDVRCVVSRLFY
jgi:hypothetical protein